MSGTTYSVHEGRPSWHQQRAGHISAAATVGFKTREEAEVYMAGFKAHHPDEPAFVVAVAEPCGVCKGAGGIKAPKGISGHGMVRNTRKGDWLRCMACDGSGKARP